MQPKYIKPAEYAKIMSMHPLTVRQHFHKGLIPGKQDPKTGTIKLVNPLYKDSNQETGKKAIIYARVSSDTNKKSLQGQISRLENYASAKGYTIVDEVTEIASGLNDHRTKFIKQIRRYFDYKFSREKRTRLKKIIEWQMANEILDIALKQKCKEIHLENLTWVNNIGGKWDFSLIYTHINYLAEIHGIKIKLINPKNTSKQNPVTKELGQVSQRNIVFKDLTVDRDQLASLNIALRGTNRKITELHSRQTMQTRYKSRRRHNYLAKNQVLAFNKNNQIVLFLHKIVKRTFTFMKLNKNISYLDNNLARRNDLSLSKLIILTN